MVKVLKAQGLYSADLGGKSDPFAVLEVCNSRVQVPETIFHSKKYGIKIYVKHYSDPHGVQDADAKLAKGLPIVSGRRLIF